VRRIYEAHSRIGAHFKKTGKEQYDRICALLSTYSLILKDVKLIITCQPAIVRKDGSIVLKESNVKIWW